MDASGSKAARQSVHLGCRCMEPGTLSGASEGGMKVGRIKDALYNDSCFGITHLLKGSWDLVSKVISRF